MEVEAAAAGGTPGQLWQKNSDLLGMIFKQLKYNQQEWMEMVDIIHITSEQEM